DAIPEPTHPLFASQSFNDPMISKKVPLKKKTSSAARRVPSVVPIPVPMPQEPPEVPIPSFHVPPAEGSQSQEFAFEVIPIPPSLLERAKEEPDLPPSRLLTPPPFIPRSDDDAQSDTESADERVRRLPPHREATTGADIPRLVEEPRMGEYFQKRRDLLNILKSLHSTGWVFPSLKLQLAG
ncbi:hypothetical protein FRC01_004630, partial [Tulasnella sp. 417]